MTKVKICGITNLEDAKMASDLGADQLGFNFYAGSKRFVSDETVRSIIDGLGGDEFKVGVFVNETVERILEKAKIARLNAVQLHGDESNEMIREVRASSGLMVLKAFRIGPETGSTDIIDSSADAVLLDTLSSAGFGGTGITFDWNIAKEIVLWRPASVYLAGGLTPGNVGEAIKMVRPFAVDVASGVEIDPRNKAADAIERFITAVRSVDT